MDTEAAQHLATRALALARAQADSEGAAVVLRGLARGNREVLVLARSRCLAALDQHPNDDAARRAVALLTAALDTWP